jgi:hypothetical protein
MKFKPSFLLVVICICFVTNSFSQKGKYPIQNGFSLTGGITQFDIITDNFSTRSSNGFLGGMSATVDIPLRWYNVSFGMQLSESTIEILGRPTLISTEDAYIKYKLFAAQVAMLLHIKARNQEGYYISNYTNLNAQDITNISQFNLNGAVGASLGVKNFKLKAQYIYGFTNILKKLESQNLDTTGGNARFKGNQSMLVLGAIVSF